MAKKPYTHTAKSNRICSIPGCFKLIKENVLARKPNTKVCYDHWREMEKGHGNTISTASEVRTGKRPHRTHFETKHPKNE